MKQTDKEPTDIKLLNYFDLGHAKRVWLRLFWEVDTTTVRLILAFSSLICAISLITNGDLMTDVPSFRYLLDVADIKFWTALYTMHFAGVFWRFFDPIPRIAWALAINILGLAIWLCPTFSVVYVYGSITPGSAIGVVVCLFGAWALYRTGLGKEVVTP